MLSTTVCTVPYRPPSITEHLTKDWMRLAVSTMQKPKRVNRMNLDNRLALVFWHEDGKPAKIQAVHERPRWPKWILMGAIDIRKQLDIHATLLEYYDTRSFQWITSTCPTLTT
ncbi:hypothetical protein BDZ97DRAFT_1756999 [Flammula alnicola]|nr:hypothetical protein BDZ97DRAFT_1756999 [Flammula alnicola]